MTSIDLVVFQFLNGLAGKFLLTDWLFIFLAEYLIYVLTALFIFFLLKITDWKRRAYMLYLGVLAVVLSRGIATPLIRFFFEKPRPFVALELETLVSHIPTSSFPSGHITFILPLAIALWYINKRAGAWSLVGVLLIGASRIIAGLHWPTDIVGGLFVGAICFAIAQAVLERAFGSKKEKGAPVDAPIKT